MALANVGVRACVILTPPLKNCKSLNVQQNVRVAKTCHNQNVQLIKSKCVNLLYIQNDDASPACSITSEDLHINKVGGNEL